MWRICCMRRRCSAGGRCVDAQTASGGSNSSGDFDSSGDSATGDDVFVMPVGYEESEPVPLDEYRQRPVVEVSG